MNLETTGRVSACCFSEIILNNSSETGVVGDICEKCGNACDWIPKIRVDLTKQNKSLESLEKFTKCHHVELDYIDVSCPACNMAWAIERIKVLEMQPKKIYLVQNKTSSVYFSTKEKALSFIEGYSVATGLQIVEIDIF